GYMLMAEKAVGDRDAVSLLVFGFFFASIFWAVAQPWWSFPFHVPATTVSLLGNLSEWHLPVWSLILWMVIVGTIVPFFLIVGSRDQVAEQRGEVDRVERLCQIVEAAEVEAARAVAELGSCGQEHDRDRGRRRVLEQLLGDPPAVEPRHHHVEEDHVRAIAPR